MHPRRWAWHLASLDSTNRPLVVPNGSGFNAFAGFQDVRAQGAVGELQGLPVYVDPNVPTNLGAGTNEDEIYFVSQRESHLWEDPNAPVLIRAEQTSAKSLGVDLVVYAYFAYLFTRTTHAQKVNGTGLVTPTF